MKEEKKARRRKKVQDRYAKRKALDEHGRITAYKLHRLNCEVEKLMAKAKVNTGKSIIYCSFPF